LKGEPFSSSKSHDDDKAEPIGTIYSSEYPGFPWIGKDVKPAVK
jgi:hypothetical protein